MYEQNTGVQVVVYLDFETTAADVVFAFMSWFARHGVSKLHAAALLLSGMALHMLLRKTFAYFPLPWHFFVLQPFVVVNQVKCPQSGAQFNWILKNSIGIISHPWQRDTGKYAAQGPNIMSPEGPRMLPEGRRAELEARGQHPGARGRHNVARGRHISSGPRPGV